MRTPLSSHPALFSRMFSFTVHRHFSLRLQMARASVRGKMARASVRGKMARASVRGKMVGASVREDGRS